MSPITSRSISRLSPPLWPKRHCTFDVSLVGVLLCAGTGTGTGTGNGTGTGARRVVR